MRTIGVLGLVLLSACASAPEKPASEDVWIAPQRASSRAGADGEHESRAASGGEAPAFDQSSFGPSASTPRASGPAAAPAEPNGADATGGLSDAPASDVAASAKAPGLAAAGATKAPPTPLSAPTKSGTADRKVQVAGLEGTLSSFDVRVTMDAKSREFGACHAPRLRRVPSLGGSVEFKIRVLADGTVSAVELPTSDVGDRALERCFTGVIMATAFPKPHGGDANVTYTMSLGVARKGREPEVWESERIRHIVIKRADDLRETCDLKSTRPFHATVYVNRRGKVIAAGVAGKGDQVAAFDCIAEAVRKWPMPKARKKAFAKVSFPMSGTS